MKRRHALKPMYVCMLLALATQPAQANPFDPSVVNGQASFAAAGNTLTVTNTPGAIINWQGFSIGSNEITRFAQQSASSAVLNRVISGNPSSILGSLLSNGRVFLVNPNGIVFGAGATVNVAGLVATTLNLSNADFLAGRHNYTQVPGAQNLGNAGNITAQGDGQSGGQIFMIAPNVENTGVITAPNGEILLAAGHSVELVNSNAPSLRVSITAPAGDATNVGQLVASAGKLGLFGTVVRNSGIVSADSAVLQGGRIVFKASQRVDAGGTVSANGVGGGEIKLLADMQNGAVDVNAVLAANAPGAGNGGFIETSAAHVQVADTARISTAAPFGKTGTWLIDPTDYYIATSNPGGGVSYMSNTVLATSLASNNITIQTLASNNGTDNGDIFVNDAVSWSSANSLTLNAVRNVNINAAIGNTGTGNLIARSDLNGISIGTIIFGAGGSVALSGGGRADLYYNPSAYNNPNNYSANMGSTPFTAWMLVNDVNQLQAMDTNLGGTYALGRNIDATGTSTWNAGTGFAPVGNLTTNFTGSIDGLGHTITNLTINRPSTDYVGLFGYTGVGSIIKNVGLVGGSVTGYNAVGGLVGKGGGGTITNSYSTGSVSGGLNSIGGLVGFNSNTITNSYSAGSVNGGGEVGGLVGYNFWGTITNSYSTGSVNGGSSGYLGARGGLVAVNQSGVITNSYSTGAVNGTGGAVGGLVGASVSGTVTNSYWDTVTSLQSTSPGGGTGRSTAGMMQTANFTGWDFTNTWWLSAGNTRPFLQSEWSTTINNAHQLQLMGMNATTLAAGYTLGANINMAELSQTSGLWNTTTGFVPVGDTWATRFIGAFDGLGHNITGLTINRGSANNIGLFGVAASATGIRNVGLVGGSVTGSTNVGLLVGFNGEYGTGTITNSYATGNVSGWGYVGGLVGYNNGAITNSYATGTVNGIGGYYVGGLVGTNGVNGAITYSYSTGNVNSTWYFGGLAGSNTGNITSSYSTSVVTGSGGYIGGLVGDNSSFITNSYSTGSVSGVSFVGGLVGINSSITGTITKSYSTGAVSGSSSVGGLVGSNANYYGGITNSYWDMTTSLQATSAGGTPKTTAQMKQLATFSSWNTAIPNTIANTGGSGAVWRIYEGHTAPLLTSFMTGLTLAGVPDVTLTYNGSAQSGAVFTLIPNVLGAAATGTNVGFYNGYYSTQQGYDITGGNLTINPLPVGLAIALAGNKVYDGIPTFSMAQLGISNIVSGDVVSLSAGTADTADKNVGINKPFVSFSGLALTGMSAGNYTLTGISGTGTITQLASVAYTGVSGNWSNAANWAGGAIPDHANVAAVTIPSGVTVTYDSGVSGTTMLNTLTSSGSLAMAAGALTLNAASNMSALSMSGGALTAPVGLTVNNYTQTGGTLNIGGATLLQSAGSMSVNGAIASNTGGTLTLQAANNISLGTGGSITGTVTPLNVVLNSNSTGAGGAIVMNSGSSITSNGGNITLGGGTTGNGTGNAVGNATYIDGIYLTGATLDAAGGNIALNGTGFAGVSSANGIYVTNASYIQTGGAGTVTLNGTGGAGTSNNNGVRIGTNSVISSINGAIALIGQGAGSGGSNYGMYVHNGATVGATGSGAITLNGTGGAGTSNNYGVRLSSGMQIRSANGAIFIMGQGAGTGGSNYGIIHTNTSGAITSTGSSGITLYGRGAGSAEGVYAANSISGLSGVVTINSNNGAIGSGSIQASGLRLLGTGTFNLGSTSNDIGTLAANVTGSVNYTDANSFAVGYAYSFDGANYTSTDGLATNGGAITLTAAGDINQTSGLISNNVTSGTAPVSDITLNAANITLQQVQSQRHVVLNATAGVNLLGVGSGGYSDDKSFQFNLPFAFNYFGTSYNQAYITTNGLITFGGGTYRYSDSIAGLGTLVSDTPGTAGRPIAAIAPAWNDWILRTSIGKDIHIGYGTNDMKVRFDVARYNNESLNSQFEAVLNSNGVINFNYGAANNSFAGDVTIGLSNGMGTTIASQLMTQPNFSMNYLNSTAFTPNGTGGYTETVSTGSTPLSHPGIISGSAILGQGSGQVVNALGNLTINAGGAINAPSRLAAQALNFIAHGGAVFTGDNIFSAISGTNYTSGDIVFYNTAAPLRVNALSNTGGNILLNNFGGIEVAGAVSSSGNLEMSAQDQLTVSNGATLNAGGNLNLSVIAATPTAGDLNINGGVGASGTLTAAAGNINVNAGGYFNTSSGALSATAGNDVNVVDGGYINSSNGPISLTARSGNFNVNRRGYINTRDGSIAILAGNDVNLLNRSYINSYNGPISLTATSGNVNINTGDAYINSSGGTISVAATAGNINIDTDGYLNTGSGAIDVAAGGDVNFATRGHINSSSGVVSVAGANNVNLTHGGYLNTYSGAINVAADGNVNLATGGYINTSSGDVAVKAGNDANVNAGHVRGATAALLVGHDLNIQNGSIWSNGALYGLVGRDVNITGGASGLSGLYGNPDVGSAGAPFVVGGAINLNDDATGTYGGQIHSGMPYSTWIHFPNLASGGYFVNGVGGAVSNGASGFYANGQPAVLDSNLHVSYGLTLPAPTPAPAPAASPVVAPPQVLASLVNLPTFDFTSELPSVTMSSVNMTLAISPAAAGPDEGNGETQVVESVGVCK